MIKTYGKNINDCPDLTQKVNDEKNYWNKKLKLNCVQCNRLLVNSKDFHDATIELREKWIKQGYWFKHPMHGEEFTIPCTCGTLNFISVILHRYKSDIGTDRYKSFTLRFPTKEAMKEFWKILGDNINEPLIVVEQ